MANHEKILEKIKKLFELANNNPSAEEAKSAALKAQELMTQYHITAIELDNIDLDKVEEIEEVAVNLAPKKWKYDLARICAPNFRCQFFYFGKKILIFYGHKTDATIAAETFKYLFKVGDALGKRLYYEAKCAFKDTTNVYNSCVMGFCAGVREALAEQSKALMVIVPEDVKAAYKTRTANCRSMHIRGPHSTDAAAYDKGREHGYHAMKRNALNS